MGTNCFVIPRPCGYCGIELDVNASYMGRKYHKYNPNCGQRHTSFQAKIRKCMDSDSEFVIEFCKFVINRIEAGFLNEIDIDPTLNLVLRKRFLPLIRNRSRKIKC